MTNNFRLQEKTKQEGLGAKKREKRNNKKDKDINEITFRRIQFRGE